MDSATNAQNDENNYALDSATNAQNDENNYALDSATNAQNDRVSVNCYVTGDVCTVRASDIHFGETVGNENAGSGIMAESLRFQPTAFFHIYPAVREECNILGFKYCPAYFGVNTAGYTSVRHYDTLPRQTLRTAPHSPTDLARSARSAQYSGYFTI